MFGFLESIGGVIEVGFVECIWCFILNWFWLFSGVCVVVNLVFEDVVGNNFYELLDYVVGMVESVFVLIDLLVVFWCCVN